MVHFPGKLRVFTLAVLVVLIGVACSSPITLNPTPTASIPTADPNEIRVRQAVANVIEPNIRSITNAANAYLDQFFTSIGLAPLWRVRYELEDWQIKSWSADEYQILVKVKYSDDCRAGSPPGCANQRAEWANAIGHNLRFR